MCIGEVSACSVQRRSACADTALSPTLHAAPFDASMQHNLETDRMSETAQPSQRAEAERREGEQPRWQFWAEWSVSLTAAVPCTAALLSCGSSADCEE